MTTVVAHDFPGFYTPYFSLLTFPVAGVAAIAAKYFCYRRFSENQNRPDLSDVIFALCASFGIGMLTMFLAGEIIHALPTMNAVSISHTIESLISKNVPTLIAITFSMACMLSIFAEFAALRFLTRDDETENIFQISIIANCVSYTVQAVIVWVWVTWIW